MERELRLLLLEDNAGDVRLMRETLSEAPGVSFSLEVAARLDDGLTRLAAETFDLVLLDLSLPDAHGLEALAAVRDAAPDLPVVVMSGSADEETAVRAVGEGAQDYLVKGRTEASLLARSVRYAISRHRMAAELDQSRRAQLDMRDQFLSHVSHELRSPLAAVYGFLRIVLDGLAGPLTDDQGQYLRVALQNLGRLESMIGDLLEATRVETGKLTVDPRRVEVQEVVGEVIETLRAGANGQGIALSAPAASTLPPVLADPGRLRQVLVNLVENAIKYTPSGGRIVVSCESPGEIRGLVRISVSDTGSGIAKEALPHVFDRLYQGGQGGSSSGAGLGLGLFICKELVGRQGGAIWAESEVGKGSTFHFTLPVFSLEAPLRPVLVEGGSLRPSVSLISLRLAAPAPLGSRWVERVTRAMREVVQKSILPDRDVLLPCLTAGGDVEPLFVVASTDEVGAARMSDRLVSQLGGAPELREVRFEAEVKAVEGPPPDGPVDDQLKAMASRIESLVTSAVLTAEPSAVG